jgi:uncharacterized protein involved in exopolysaccharide biosynthesis
MTKRVILTDTGTTDPNATERVQTPPAEAASFQFNINVFELISLLIAKRKLIIGAVAVSVLATIGYLLLQPNQYTSHATILPSGKAMSSSLNSVRSLVGLADPTPFTDENSSAIFPVILRSNLVMDGVMKKTYTFADNDQKKTMTLGEYFDEDNPDKLRKALRDQTYVESNKMTAEISIGVKTMYPELSRQIVGEYIRLLEDFNLNKRQTSAKFNCQYLSKQIELVGTDLHAAEDKLQDYQQHNMSWNMQSDPELTKEVNRLQREVDLKSTTFNNLSQQYENAKLEAQKDVPIVRVLDAPTLPTVKSGPFRTHAVIVSIFMSFGLMCLVIIILDVARQGIQGDNRKDFNKFRDDFQTTFPRTERVINRLSSRLIAAKETEEVLQE